MRGVGSVEGVGAPLSPNRVGGDNFIRYIGDRLILDFHEGAGTTVRDLSGNGNDGTFGAGAAAPTWERNRLSFDGGDHIDCGSAPSLDNLFPLTYEGRIKGKGFIIAKSENASLKHFVIHTAFWFGIYLKLSSTDIDYKSVDSSVDSEKWTDLTGVVYLDKTAKLYINSLESTYSLQQQGIGTVTDDSADSLTIGRRLMDAGSIFNGAMSFIRINATAFSANQVLAEYLWNKWRN